MKEENNLTEMESLFLALSDKTRLRLLNLLRKDELCVYYFTEVLGESQPKISRHLAYLRNAGIVSARRQGKWIYYRIVILENKFASLILQDTLDWLEMQEDMQQDYKKLSEIWSLDAVQITTPQVPARYIFTDANMKANVKEELEVFLL